jgi:hypothetical protein
MYARSQGVLIDFVTEKDRAMQQALKERGIEPFEPDPNWGKPKHKIKPNG